MTSAQQDQFGRLLRRHRVAARLTQEELADLAALSARGISDLERGLRSAPYKDTIERLAGALRLSGGEREEFVAAARRRAAPSGAILGREPASSGPAAQKRFAEDPTYRTYPPVARQSLIDRVHVLKRPAVRSWMARMSGMRAVILSVLVLVVGAVAVRDSSSSPVPARGGTWTVALPFDPTSLIPNGGGDGTIPNMVVDQALYLPLFYGDSQGQIHPGAATEIPTLANGGINADATVWTFHLRPGLVWSDGQPYDAADVDYTWRLWSDPAFGGDFPLANSPARYQEIQSARVSTDRLEITFELKQPDSRFLLLWVDGVQAPMPAHHFKALAASQVQRTSDELNPSVTSGPFMMVDSQPGDHYTLARNPRYYLAGQGLPYLDRLQFRIGSTASVLGSFQAGSADSTELGRDLIDLHAYQQLGGYKVVASPTSATFEALFFNFHNEVLGGHLEVREAIARAINHQALINGPLHGIATPLCTDHPSALHPGYQPDAYCPDFSVASANKILDDAGWVRGADGVRSKAGQRLEFEYSTTADPDSWRNGVQALVRQDLANVGIKLDVENYPGPQFFNSVLAAGKASPPTGAVAGNFDIAEFEWVYGYDSDESVLLRCDQVFPGGENFGAYCNPALDALFHEELTTPDAGLRQNVYDQMHQIYVTDFPFITLFSPDSVIVVSQRAHNDEPSPIVGETINVWNWWCSQGTC